MNLKDYFENLFQKADGVDPQTVINKIQTDFPVQFFVDCQGYNNFQLKDFIQEPNCGIVFHQQDGFDKNFRINFINTLPEGTKASEVVVVNTGFTDKELKVYGGLGASIVVANADGNIWHRWTIESFAKKATGKIIVIPVSSSWYSAANIRLILKSPTANIHLVIRKGQFASADISSFILLASSHIEIDKKGFEISELTTFKSEGATIV